MRGNLSKRTDRMVKLKRLKVFPEVLSLNVRLFQILVLTSVHGVYIEPAPVPNQNNDNDKGFSPTSSTSSNDANKPKQRRVPPPTFEPEHDDKALDAAAAREVSRELEALKNSPPMPSENTQQALPEPAVDRGRVPAAADSYVNEPEEASSLPPPSAPFAQRNPSPHPYADLNVNTNQSPPYLGGYTAAQSYAQSYQTAGS